MSTESIRGVLNTVFLILTAATLICYFVFPDDRTYFFYSCMAAIFVKLMEIFIRFTR